MKKGQHSKFVFAGLAATDSKTRRNYGRAAAATLLMFFRALAAAYTIFWQDLTPDLTPTHHPSTSQHFTPTSLPTIPLHLIAISILAINSPSRACRWASHWQPLRTERPSSSTRISPLTPANTQPTRPLASIHKSLGCTLSHPSPKSVRMWGVHWHRTGWHLVGVPLKFTLQTV